MAQTNAATVAAPVYMPPQSQKLKNFTEVDTQPLFWRAKIAAGTIAGLTRIDAFTAKRNSAPHLTNSEEIQAMPSTSAYSVASVELVPNGNCDPGDFRAMLASCRLVIEVGTKGMEKLNQPCAFLASSVHTGVDNTASVRAGLYTFNPGEEIAFDPDQPFRVYLQADDAGFKVTTSLDFFIKLRGQKRSKVSLG